MSNVTDDMPLFLAIKKSIFMPKKASFNQRYSPPEYGSQDFCLIVEDDIEIVKKEFEKKGYPLVEGIVERHGAKGNIKSLYLRDPDGNLVELANYCN
nr:hypothetical protein [uncultured Gilliamella sp.]